LGEPSSFNRTAVTIRIVALACATAVNGPGPEGVVVASAAAAISESIGGVANALWTKW